MMRDFVVEKVNRSDFNSSMQNNLNLLGKRKNFSPLRREFVKIDTSPIIRSKVHRPKSKSKFRKVFDLLVIVGAISILVALLVNFYLGLRLSESIIFSLIALS